MQTISNLRRKYHDMVHTGLASSTAILDIRINDLSKYLTAFVASLWVLYPTYPIRRWGINLASVTGESFEKCFLKSSALKFGGSPRIKILETSISSCHDDWAC